MNKIERDTVPSLSQNKTETLSFNTVILSLLSHINKKKPKQGILKFQKSLFCKFEIPISFDIQRCHYMYKRGHFIVSYCPIHMCIDLPRLTGSHITVDVDEYESLSSAIIPILPISLPRDLSGQL